MVGQKGYRSIKLKKVKGHSTAEQVQEGHVRKEDKDGNDRADQGARKGANDSQRIIAALAEAYAARHKQYLNFVKRLTCPFCCLPIFQFASLSYALLQFISLYLLLEFP